MTMPEQQRTAELDQAGDDAGAGKGNPVLALVNDYVTLTKPPIILLYCWLPPPGECSWPKDRRRPAVCRPWVLMALVWLGGALASGGANALNHHYDRDIDGIMQRTRQRPVASNRISPAKALIFGIALNVAAFAILYLWVNWLAAALTLAATLFYVLVYTRWLKRSTPPQHRHRGRGRRGAADGRLGRRYRHGGTAGGVSLRHCLLLDTAPLLGLVYAAGAGLPAGQGADAVGGGYPGLYRIHDFPLQPGLWSG